MAQQNDTRRYRIGRCVFLLCGDVAISIEDITLGFNYRFDALETDAEDNELNKAFSSAFHTGKKMGVVPIIRTIFPSLRWLVCIGSSYLYAGEYILIDIGLILACFHRCPHRQDENHDESYRRAAASREQKSCAVGV